jgi:hypothetical protein
MTEAQEDIDLLNNVISRECWLYANPLTGKHAKSNTTDSPLAVFKDENIGRAYEIKSDILKGMIGYYAIWDEMLDIARKETSGKYDYITVVR